MENAAFQKKQTFETPSAAPALWNPFWFVDQLFGGGRSGDAPSFDVDETHDAYVYKINVGFALPDHVDLSRVKVEIQNGQLTLVVPKAVAATPKSVSQRSRTRRMKGSGRGASGRTSRRRAHTTTRRG